MIWKDQSATFPTKIAWTWSAIDHVQSPEDWHKNCAGARHILSEYLAESDVQNNFKNRTKYKIRSITSTRRHATKNKHKNDNWFKEHFGENLSSQNTRNGVSENQDFNIFWGSMPPDPPSGWPLQRSPDSSVIFKKKTRFYILKKLDSLSVLTWYPQRSTPLNKKITKVRWLTSYIIKRSYKKYLIKILIFIVKTILES